MVLKHKYLLSALDLQHNVKNKHKNLDLVIVLFVNKVIWFNTERCKLIILGVYNHQKASANMSLRVPSLQDHQSTRSSISFCIH